MNKFKIKYQFEVGSGICLWSDDMPTQNLLGYAIEFKQLPLKENTIRWLTHLISWFDTSIDWENPGQPNLRWTLMEKSNFVRAYHTGLEMLRSDLNPDYYQIKEGIPWDQKTPMEPSDAEESNFFGVLTTSQSKETVATMYKNIGWQMRKIGYDDFEITSSIACLVMDGSNEILLHGSVAHPGINYKEITLPLEASKISFKVEIYDGEGKIIFSQENNYP